MSCGRQTGTPPTADVRAAKPEKSTTMVWSTRRPVSCSTVFWVQAGFPSAVSPTENAPLNMTWCWGAVQSPPGVLHAGMSTRESRGMDTATACRLIAVHVEQEGGVGAAHGVLAAAQLPVGAGA